MDSRALVTLLFSSREAPALCRAPTKRRPFCATAAPGPPWEEWPTRILYFAPHPDRYDNRALLPWDRWKKKTDASHFC